MKFGCKYTKSEMVNIAYSVYSEFQKKFKCTPHCCDCPMDTANGNHCLLNTLAVMWNNTDDDTRIEWIKKEEY